MLPVTTSKQPITVLLSRGHFAWCPADNLGCVKYRIRSQMRRLRRQQLLLAIDQIGGVERSYLEAMTVSDGIRRACLDAISAENAAIVVNVVNLGVALGAADAVLSRVLSRLDINTI